MNKDDPIVINAIHIDPFEGYSSNREAVVTPQKEPRRFIGSNFQFPPRGRKQRREAEAALEATSEKRCCGFWFQFVISTILCIGTQVACLILFFYLVILDSNGNIKPFKAACFTTSDMADNVCFFSAGLVSTGIISVGEASVGLISLGQVSIGVLVAIGQASLGCGYSFGQIASGFYVPMAQIGFGLYKVSSGQLVFQCIVCLLPNLGKRLPTCFNRNNNKIFQEEKPIMCNKCECGFFVFNHHRRPRRY
jgi:hypothetical protein